MHSKAPGCVQKDPREYQLNKARKKSASLCVFLAFLAAFPVFIALQNNLLLQSFQMASFRQRIRFFDLFEKLLYHFKDKYLVTLTETEKVWLYRPFSASSASASWAQIGSSKEMSLGVAVEQWKTAFYFLAFFVTTAEKNEPKVIDLIKNCKLCRKPGFSVNYSIIVFLISPPYLKICNQSILKFNFLFPSKLISSPYSGQKVALVTPILWHSGH